MPTERDRVGYQQRPDKPLIRLRVDYSGEFELFSTHRFDVFFIYIEGRRSGLKFLLYIITAKHNIMF